MKILILNGHDNFGNAGAQSKWGSEQGLNRNFSKLIKTEIESMSSADVYIYNPNLNDKSMYTFFRNGGNYNFREYGYVLELHFNAKVKKDPDGDGIQTGCGIYVHTSEKGVSVERAILQNIESTGMKIWDTGISARNDLLVQNTVKAQGISHALLEICFIDDGDDMSFYMANTQKLANAVAKGIVQGFKLSASYSVKVSIPNLNIRKDPDVRSQRMGYTGIGTFTIVEEASGYGATKWGKLKSGAGWISLDYTTR